MPFQISPGVNVSEIDLTTIIPAVATTDAAYCGQFQWGPVDEITLVNNQEVLASTFGKPVADSAEHWWTASNFLDYGNKLHLVRVVADSTTGPSANTACESPSASARLLIKNDSDYISTAGEAPYGVTATSYADTFGKWAAKFPGEYGNNLKVSICDSYPGAFSNATVLDTANTTAGSKSIFIHSNTNFSLGDVITFRESIAADIAATGAGKVSTEYTQTLPTEEYKIVNFVIGAGADSDSVAAGNNTEVVLNKAVSTTATNIAVDRKWEFYNNFDQAPGTSGFAESRGAANDEIHIVVADATGAITGVKGQPIETYASVSKAQDAKADDGSSNYYVDVINEKSKWVRFINHPADGDQIVPAGAAPIAALPGRKWGNTAFIDTTTTDSGTETFKVIEGGDGRAAPYGPRAWRPDNITLSGGNNGITTTASAFQLGYDKFADPEETDISLVLGGPADGTVARYIIENVAEKRKDCVAFISPEKADVTGQDTMSTKTTNVKNFRLTTDGINSKSSSYGVMDSGWKYQYDKFRDLYVWVPLNADTAGLCVRTDQTRDPWFSPAGLNRGHVKNVVKLAWNPQLAHRDELYKNGINPVVTIKGQGTVLYGDKTLQAKPSAFDRINVRRLFIVLEKAIATAAKFMLFEFNDEFTRSQFRNMVEPFLRDVQGRRGIYDFRVVCDETNNTGEVIDRNEFVGDIYIKPARSINFIQLNFVAVRTGVDFEEVVGKF